MYFIGLQENPPGLQMVSGLEVNSLHPVGNSASVYQDKQLHIRESKPAWLGTGGSWSNLISQIAMLAARPREWTWSKGGASPRYQIKDR